MEFIWTSRFLEFIFVSFNSYNNCLNCMWSDSLWLQKTLSIKRIFILHFEIQVLCLTSQVLGKIWAIHFTFLWKQKCCGSFSFICNNFQVWKSSSIWPFMYAVFFIVIYLRNTCDQKKQAARQNMFSLTV